MKLRNILTTQGMIFDSVSFPVFYHNKFNFNILQNIGIKRKKMKISNNDVYFGATKTGRNGIQPREISSATE